MNTISFPKIFNINNGYTSTSLSYNYKSTNESLAAMFHVNQGELLGDPSYGTKLKEHMFDVKTPRSVQELKIDILEYIEKSIPSIYVDGSRIKIYSNPNNNQYKITISYYIKSTMEENTFETIMVN